MQRRQAFKHLVALGGLILVGGPAFAQGNAQFQVLSNPQPPEVKGKIEIIEFFHYGCPHCRKLDPLLEQWLKNLPGDVAFRRVPAIWGNAQLAALARFYYAGEVSGDLAKLHGKVFQAVQDDKVALADKDPKEAEAATAEWVAKQGVDAKKFMEAYKSFGVNSKIERANQLARTYQIDGVPTLIVGGKYAVKGDDASVLKTTDELLARVRKEQAKG